MARPQRLEIEDRCSVNPRMQYRICNKVFYLDVVTQMKYITRPQLKVKGLCVGTVGKHTKTSFPVSNEFRVDYFFLHLLK